MQALVTGGAGFIGSHLVEALLAQGHRVCVLDDLSTGNTANLQHLAGHAGLRCLTASVLDRAVVEEAVAGCDQVYHLASAVGVQLIIDQPVRTMETIIGGTENVLRAARAHRCPVLLTSSSEVYGKATKLPFAESDDVVIGPTTTRRWAYACAKMADEFLALAHWHEAQLPVVCVRLFNTVGPRQTGHYGMVLPRLIGQAVRAQPLTVYGDGQQSRCFCHVQDIVAALVQLAACPAACGQVVNLGTQEAITILALAERIIARTGSRSTIQRVPYAQAYVSGFEDMRQRVPDLVLAQRLIGFTPRIGLDQIIDELAAIERRSLAGSA